MYPLMRRQGRKMMLRNRLIAVSILSLCGILCASVAQALDLGIFSALIDRAKITRGRPTEAWNSPLGDNNLTRKQASKMSEAAEEELKKELDKITEEAEKEKKNADNEYGRKLKEATKKAQEARKKVRNEYSTPEEQAGPLKAIDDNFEAENNQYKKERDEAKQKADDKAEAQKAEAYNNRNKSADGKDEDKSAIEENVDASSVDDTHFNRCRLIKLIKPGADKVEEMQRVATILQSYYSSELYTQAMQILYELDKEDPHPFSNQSSKKAILDKNIKDVLLDTTQRLAIVASLEARTAVVENISKIIALGPEIYQDETCKSSQSTQTSNSGTQGGGK